MPYVTPRWWKFKDQVNESYLNTYSDNLNDLAAKTFLPNQSDSGVASANHRSEGYVFAHMHPYLYYLNHTDKDGNIESVIVEPYDSSVGDPVTLADTSDTNGGYVNIEDEVDWMAPGLLYVVRGVEYAFEVKEV